MRIAIDAHQIGLHATGNETYASNLVRALLALDGEHEYLLYLSPGGRDCLSVECQGRARLVCLPTDHSFLRLALYLPRALLRDRPDLYHSSLYVLPLWCPAPSVVTIHDISFERYPEYFSRSERLLRSQMIRHAAHASDQVIAVSEATRADLMEIYNVDPRRITVIYEASGAEFCPIADPARLTATISGYGIRQPYILFVGNLQPRKNLVRLVKAFEELKQSGDLPEHQLVIVGQAAWLYDDIFDSVWASRVAQNIVFTGYVPQGDLVSLYNAADVFVYPSLLEGFGLPIIEAMSCGTPVVTSETSCMPEVAGDAAVLVDPFDVASIAEGIRQVACDTAFSGQLAAKGLARARYFSWDRTARETLAVYERVYASYR